MGNENLKVITASELYKLVDPVSINETKDYIQKNNIKLKKSTKYNVLINNNLYPPKDFLRTLAKLKGYQVDENTFFGGKANNPFVKLDFKIMSKNEFPSYNSDSLEQLIRKYQYAIDNTDWLREDEIYKFHFIKWIEDNIDFLNDSNEVIKQKIEDSQQISFTPNSNEKGVNFLQTIVRYQDEYLTLDDIIKLKKVVSGDKEISKDNIKLSFKSYPKTSAFLSFFNPSQFIAYDSESLPSYQYLSSNVDGQIIPKSGFKAFEFYQLFYKNIKIALRNSQLDITIFKELLNVEALTELQWNFIAQDFLLYVTREIMNSENEDEAIKLMHVHEDDMSHPLNQILYGPPGTGKTYSTKQLAVEIIDGTAPVDRNELTERYNELRTMGQIQFTTFHQSMSYEDFIEGIKPKIEESEEGVPSVIYSIEDGVFKLMVDKAKEYELAGKLGHELYGFEEAWSDLIEKVTERIENEEILELPIKTDGMAMNVLGITDRGNMIVTPKHSNSDINYIVSYNRSKKLQKAFPDLYKIKNIDKEFRSIIGGSNATAYWSVVNYLNNSINTKQNSPSEDLIEDNKKYVLIIDEINRGNVSAIFGELITLLEDDKREGKEEALEAILPYSKVPFSIPSNVYIIGTMNTADRSVEALDTALRRRFSFKEIAPQPELLIDVAFKEVDLALMLQTINQRIEFLIDKDHQIGHSYLMKVKSIDDLRMVFKNNIIPLLEEYFYGDFGKIGLVLGDRFVQLNVNPNDNILANFNAYEDVNFVTDKQLFLYVKPIDKMDVSDFKSIYSEIENV